MAEFEVVGSAYFKRQEKEDSKEIKSEVVTKIRPSQRKTDKRDYSVRPPRIIIDINPLTNQQSSQDPHQ